MSWDFKSIAVVGSGAVGLYYGGRLAEAGENVHFLVRSDYDAISNKGITGQSIHGDFHLTEAQAYRSAEEIGPVDLVIVAWKTTANAQLHQVLPPLLHENTQVITLQNGLGNCELLEKIVGPERVLGGLCFVCINRLSPGIIHHSAGGRLAIGEWQPDSQGRAAELTRRFLTAKVQAVEATNLGQAQWEKLIWNIPFNGLSVSEGGVTTEVLLASAKTEQRIRHLMEEVVRAANALGFNIDEDLITWNIERTRPMAAYRTSSMIDYVNGREIEIAPIWEEPLRRAKAIGIDMPYLEELLLEIKAVAANR